MKKLLITTLSTFLLMGCLPTVEETTTIITDTDSDNPTVTTTSWLDIELKDVNTGNTFTLSDFAGQKILIESFAVWCPTCLKQQNIIKELKEEQEDSFISVALDTDPNENEENVKQHLEENGFDWYFVVSPTTLTQALIDEFGITVVNAPSAPIILVCEDQSYRFLTKGLKEIDELKQELNQGC